MITLTGKSLHNSGSIWQKGRQTEKQFVSFQTDRRTDRYSKTDIEENENLLYKLTSL